MIDPVALRRHYSAFVSPERILLTGHSHQAWPDVAREGLLESFDLAAEHVDDKWDAVFAAQNELRAHIAGRLGCRPDEIAFAQSTHELVVRFLSAVPLRSRPRVVSTTGEFHSAWRQLRRLAEEGVEVVFVDAEPVATLAERVAAAIDERTSAVVMSTVLFSTSSIVPSLEAVTSKAARTGTHVLLDAYHAFDAVPWKVPTSAFVVAGGYKYAQWGEGVCFLRVPETDLRPVYTGWFAGFADLAHARDGSAGLVTYAKDGATRFAGSTFDPSATFRARAVARFFDAQGLTPEQLRACSQRQTRRIVDRVRKLPLASPADDASRGGFVAFRSDRAAELVDTLRRRCIYMDSRGALLRVGPAPYVTDEEIDRALELLETLV